MDLLFASKRSLLEMRRVAAPQRDMINMLMRHDTRLIDETLRAYFRDIYDHLLRITEQIDTHRDLLAGALDIYLSMVSNRLNEVVKVLTIVTAIFASLTVISGIYGMNFERSFPPFEWRYGFVAVLGIMAASIVAMLALFRRLRWL
jgi:magnesium transporter